MYLIKTPSPLSHKISTFPEVFSGLSHLPVYTRQLRLRSLNVPIFQSLAQARVKIK